MPHRENIDEPIHFKCMDKCIVYAPINRFIQASMLIRNAAAIAGKVSQ